VSDKPFTTLSSKYQRRYVDSETSFLFIDTIGFVIDLDPRLIKSFELNLEDIRSSDLVMLLLDITDPIITLRIKISEGIRLLREMEVPRERIMLVLNKIDIDPSRIILVDEELGLERYGIPWIMISALKRENIDSLLSMITEKLKEQQLPLLQINEKDRVEIIGSK
jgi:GTP-binding protein HflX